MSVRQVNAPTHHWKKIRQYIFLMPVLIYVENTKSIFKYRGRNNHCGTTANKIGVSATYLLRYMKDDIKP